MEVKTFFITADNLEEFIELMQQRPYKITGASIKEGLCNFSYEVLSGPMKGSKVPNHKGGSLVHQDMINAFQKLEVHLATAVDEFKYIIKKYDNLEKLENHEIRGLFSVSGFRIQGQDENEGFIILGEKYGTFGSIAIESPKISSSSNYPFFNELKLSLYNCVNEVYHHLVDGKSAPKLEQGEFEFDSSNEGGEFDNPIE